jgi:DNA-binding CsgD family transcriptional regulator
MDAPRLFGRDAEERQIAALVAAARNGRGGALLILGDPGIGKSSLLALRGRDRGMRELAVTGYEAESKIPYAAIHRLLLPLRPHLAALSDAHRQALQVASGTAQGPPPDRFLVGMGVLALVAAAGQETPLLCAVDDAHHLDAESMEALAFVARRLEADPAVLLFAGHDDPRLVEGAAGIPVLRVSGLDPEAATSLLRSALPEPIDPAAAAQIATATGGNPLALLDLARELDARRLTESSLADEPMPVGHHLEAFYLRRVRHLTPELQLWLLVAAADSTGNLDLIRSAARELSVLDVAEEAAELAGLVVLGGSVKFRHPLVRSSVYNGATGPDRRRVHRALSQAAADLALVELEAWHASKATLGTDPDVADRLERVADLAGSRGGFLSRASVLARAAALTPVGELRNARLVAAAEAAFAAGAVHVSKTLLDDVDTAAMLPALRGRLISLRATHALFIGDPALVHGGADMLQAAACFHGVDPSAEQTALIRAFEFTLPAERLAEGATLGDLGRRLREGAALQDGLPAAVLAALGAYIVLPYEEAVPLMRRVVDQLGALRPVELMSYAVVAVALTTALWDAVARRTLLDKVATAARDAGASQVLDTTLWIMSLAELKGGTPRASGERIAQVRELRRTIGYDAEQVVNPAFLAWSGAPRTQVEAISDAGLSMGFAGVHSAGIAALAVRDLAEGHYRDGYHRLKPLIDEPFLQVTPLELADFVEAAVRAGHVAVAEPHVEHLADLAAANGSPWAKAMADRSRALVTEGADSEPLYRAAIKALEPTDIDIERARSHLLYGEWLRRERRRRDAREQLTVALELFEHSGAPAFAERARRELTATGVTAESAAQPESWGLTSQELTVARMAASGSTNAEIGATLFISANTVDYHLRKVFQKLRISSRRQLTERLDPTP